MPFRDILVPATRGLSDAEAEQLTGSYRLETARDEPENAEGETIVEQFDVRRSSARQQVADTMGRSVRPGLCALLSLEDPRGDWGGPARGGARRLDPVADRLTPRLSREELRHAVADSDIGRLRVSVPRGERP